MCWPCLDWIGAFDGVFAWTLVGTVMCIMRNGMQLELFQDRRVKTGYFDGWRMVTWFFEARDEAEAAQARADFSLQEEYYAKARKQVSRRSEVR